MINDPTMAPKSTITSNYSKNRVRAAGKFLRLGADKFYIKGFSYGPFSPNSDGDFLPDQYQVRLDFQQIRSFGANAIRLYHTPPEWFLDACLEYGLRVLIDVPWEKHRCFFEDWKAVEEAKDRVRKTAQIAGNHPATLAISVVNEIPNDIVRYYGRDRIGRFIDDLLGIVKHQAPECLATFVNFPTTEFLTTTRHDFCSFNVYLNDSRKLAAYLDRLQHLAGNKPLILGEYGIDTIREGEAEQARLLGMHVEHVFRHGLSGSFIFSYTDAWYTSNRWIEDWAFGVTTANRGEKQSIRVLKNAWQKVRHITSRTLPRVSVVVCTYNGSRTLSECLDSLIRLNYPEYEVIVVNDGSTDQTPQIIEQYPQVIHVEQANLGLSVARNVGAAAANGTIVAYTDDDCIADEDWLYFLVQGMLDQQVDAIGGPNIPPADDNWFAKCVAASPGGPSHVMLDDHFAEHVPGCNMAFYRDKLLGIGGFDSQFRQAGDDVDVCWRFLDANLRIGFASGAMVWHHRRNSVKAYLKQQKGYGRSEAMVHFKHPKRFSALGRSKWKGVIYGEGAVGLPLLPPAIYHGQFGGAPFQTIYQQTQYSLAAWVTTLEWHLLAIFVLTLGLLYPVLLALPMTMWMMTVIVSVQQALKAPLPIPAPWWCRPLVWYLYLVQPIVRGWQRQTHLLRSKKLQWIHPCDPDLRNSIKRISSTQWDLYWHSMDRRGREELLSKLIELSKRNGWSGNFDDGWTEWDLKLVGDRWHEIRIRSATEELKWPERFTRARSTVHATLYTHCLLIACLALCVVAVISGNFRFLLAFCSLTVAVIVMATISRRRCLAAVTRLVWLAGKMAGLKAVDIHADPSSDRVVRDDSPPTDGKSSKQKQREAVVTT